MSTDVWVFVVVFLLMVLYLKGSNSNGPPGPLQIPILGNMLQLAIANKAPHLALYDLSRKYGPVMSLRIGFAKMVVISSYDAMKDFLGRAESTGRDVVGILEARCEGKNLGIVTSEGEIWRKLRSFSISTFRDYGYGKRASMETLISQEIQCFLKHLQNLINSNKGVVDFENLFALSAVNVLWTIIGGCQLDYNDEKLHYLLNLNEKMKKGSFIAVGLLNSFPILRYIAPDVTGYTLNQEISRDLRIFFTELLAKYKLKYKKTKEVNCYLDSFVEKIEETANDPNTIFTDEQFVMCAMDLFQAGTETTSQHIGYSILFMIIYPEIQKKIQQEIENVVGNGRLPQLDDRDKLIYTQATILEVFRYARITVNLVPRKVTKKFYYQNWTIEKDTVILTNLQSIHFDEKFWEDPNNFRPERFINKYGSIIAENAERIVPFGSGKRVCPGESVARDSFFLYLTTLLQLFTFQIVPGDQPPSSEPVPGLGFSHAPFRAIVKRNIR